jgi:AcrR family transcriptional regulator
MVADRSNVSPATIYNNFENKTGLLLAVLIDEGENAQQIGERLITQRQTNDPDIIFRLIEMYVGHPMEFMNKTCWRQALAASTGSSNKKFTQAYQRVDDRLGDLLINLMHCLYAEQLLKAEVDPQSLGEIIWNNVNQMFTNFISEEGMSLEELKNALHRQTTALMVLALRKDEYPLSTP